MYQGFIGASRFTFLRGLSSMRMRLLLLSFILLYFQFPFTVSQTQAFIARHYTLQEVLAECSNVIFGTVTSVNQKRMTAKVKVEENLKGESDFQEIKINLSTGQGNFPEKMIKKFKAGKPVIIFYKREGRRIPSLGHVDGTWFKPSPKTDPIRVACGGILPILKSTCTGPTKVQRPTFRSSCGIHLLGEPSPKIQALHRSSPSPKHLPVRCVCLSSPAIALMLNFPPFLPSIRSETVRSFTKGTKDRDLPTLDHADILWLGQGEICEDKYRLTKERESKIKAFVKDGGVVIVSGQDSDDDRPCPTDWIPEPMEGVERMGRSDFEPTQAAGTLFSEPNEIQFGDVFLDDTWTNWDDKYTILATTNDGKEIAFATLKYGEGMYLITGLQNETSANVFINYQIIENLIHFAVKWLDDQS